MQLSDCYLLGILGRKHGLSGHIVLVLDTDQPDLYNNLQSIFIDMNGTLVPFFISDISSLGNNRFKILLEDINFEDIEEFKGKQVYLPLSELPVLDGNKFYFHEVIGFTVFDTIHGEVGLIKEILDNTAQSLFVVESQGKKVLIPINDEWLIDVNREKKIIKLKTPEGLIDLYLN